MVIGVGRKSPHCLAVCSIGKTPRVMSCWSVERKTACTCLLTTKIYLTFDAPPLCAHTELQELFLGGLLWHTAKCLCVQLFDGLYIKLVWETLEDFHS
jgi:hypothetical protein